MRTRKTGRVMPQEPQEDISSMLQLIEEKITSSEIGVHQRQLLSSSNTFWRRTSGRHKGSLFHLRWTLSPEALLRRFDPDHHARPWTTELLRGLVLALYGQDPAAATRA